MNFTESLAKRLWRLIPSSLRERLRSNGAVVGLRNWIARRRYKGATHDEIFDDEYFYFVDRTTVESADVVADSICAAYQPTSVWDVGCGTGALLECLRARGVRGQGLELAEAALAFCQTRKLDVRPFNIVTDSLDDAGPADVVISMEVGAQLPPTAADRYVDLLCSLGSSIVFSSEIPGGGDRLSLNEQPHSYWIDKFEQRGYLLNQTRTSEWRDKWLAAKVATWFCRNVLIFERREGDVHGR